MKARTIRKADSHRGTMTINKYTQEDLRRYSFVTDIQVKNTSVYIFYKNGEDEHVRKISYRATSKQLQKLIISIKEEIGYEEQEKRARHYN